MKKLLVVLCGLLSVTAAQACNWSAENCSLRIYEEASRQVGNLKQNPKFMQEKFAELQAKAQYIDRKAASCSNWKCVNDTAFEYSSYVSKLTLNYMNTSKPAAVAAPAPVQDKWSGQCVVAAKPGVNAYVDQSGASKAGAVSEYIGYTVTQTADKYVGLKVAESGKVIGWAKKSELQMQDLRNCN